MSIGKRIKQLRIDTGLTQAEFAKRIFRDKSTISKLESDDVELSLSMRLAICHTFDAREEWILTGEGEIFNRRVINLISDTTAVAVERILAMLPRIKMGVEIHYTDKFKEKAVNHILEFPDGEIKFIYSELNMDRRPRQLEIDEIRSAFKATGKHLLTYKSSSEEVSDLVDHPSYDKLKSIIASSTIDASVPPDYPAVETFTGTSCPPIMNGWDNDLINACLILKKIFEYDYDSKKAIRENLKAFSLKIDAQQKATDLEQKNKELEEEKEVMQKQIELILHNQQELMEFKAAMEAAHKPQNADVLIVSKPKTS